MRREAEPNTNPLFQSDPAYLLRSHPEDATDPEMGPFEHLALVRDRVARMREITQTLEQLGRPS